ncbi:C-type mannose receptor 2-like [Strongylocentrotus purpuratus]|uniref:Uncharacterized protein n=1 Tax=Strongylocentrotus purpuratus TaxID=7668 RepID=A0A7M7SZR6_STRPU|nr:C-type mannose receptor 2-like [Strongylocentrotus purpuratus]
MPGTFNCSCTAGYDLDMDGRTCNDVDECDVHSDSCDTTSGVCTNMPGTFNCSCTVGYELDRDGRTCNTKCPDAFWTYFQGSCYKFLDNELSFHQALSTCQSLTNGQSCHADLVSIHSAEEQEFIASLCLEHNAGTWYWIGLHQPDSSGPFLWSDVTPVSHTNWDSRLSQPTNGHRDCAGTNKAKFHSIALVIAAIVVAIGVIVGAAIVARGDYGRDHSQCLTAGEGEP